MLVCKYVIILISNRLQNELNLEWNESKGIYMTKTGRATLEAVVRLLPLYFKVKKEATRSEELNRVKVDQTSK